MKKMLYEEKTFFKKIPIKTELKCDICNKVISKGSLYYTGYTMDTIGSHVCDTIDTFDVCYYGTCLSDMIKKYTNACMRYGSMEKPKIEITLTERK